MAYILLATDYPPQVGGIQRYVSQLAAALRKIGQNVYVIATESPGWQEYDALSPVPIRRVSATGGKLAITLRLRDAALHLAKTISEPLQGLIATKWSPEGLGTLQAARCLGVAWGVFGYDREFILHGAHIVKWALQLYLLRRADLCFAISQYTARNFQRGLVPATRIRLVGSGIASERFRPDPETATRLRERYSLQGRPVLLTVARLAAHKGHQYVLRALPQIVTQFPNVAYVIVGEGEFRPHIEREIARLGLQQNVVLAGARPDAELCGFYTMADVMILATYDIPGRPTEGFGLALLEANCCGTPVIGTQIGGMPDAIEDGRNGLLVPPKNVPALAAAILRLLRHPQMAREMGRYGQQRAATQFRWEQVAQRVHEAFEELRTR